MKKLKTMANASCLAEPLSEFKNKMAGQARKMSSSHIWNLSLFSILLNIHVSMVNCSFCGHPHFSHSTDPLDLSSQFATGEPPRPPVTVMLAQRCSLRRKRSLLKTEAAKVSFSPICDITIFTTNLTRRHSVISISAPPASDTKPSTLRIVGGMDVTDVTGGFLCWQVSIKMKTVPGLVRCGGSIIGSRTILTAAHCVTLKYLEDRRTKHTRSRAQVAHVLIAIGR